MSWKMFWQIVLLLVIASLILPMSKVGLWKCKYLKFKGGQEMPMEKEKGSRR